MIASPLPLANIDDKDLYGAVLANPDGVIGLALPPTCLKTVKRVEFDGYSGEIKIAFEGDKVARGMGYLPKSLDQAVLTACEIMVAHFDTWQDLGSLDASREYIVPLISFN